MEKKRIASNAISGKLGNKEHLYEVVSIDCKSKLTMFGLVGIYLPSYDKWTTAFMRDILSKKKSVSDMIIVLNNSLLVIETRRSDDDTSASLQRAGSKACIGDDKRSARPVELLPRLSSKWNARQNIYVVSCQYPRAWCLYRAARKNKEGEESGFRRK